MNQPGGARPGLVGSVFAVAALALALLVAVGSREALLANTITLLVVGFGLRNASTPIVTLGTAVAGVGLLAAGSGTGPLQIWMTVTGATLVLVAWDAGTHAVRLRDELGPDAPVRRVELLHASRSLLVFGGIAAASYLVTRLAPTGIPQLGVIALLVAAVALLALARG